MFDVKSVSDMRSLLHRIRQDYEKLEHVRKERREAIRSTLGNHYVDPSSDDSALRDAQPANFNGMALDILVRSLISANPKVFAETSARELTVMTETFEAAINDRIEQMRLVDPLEQHVYNAAIGPMAITLVGRERGMDSWLRETQTVHRSKTVVRTVSMDDAVWDTDARQWTELAYVAHKVRLREDEFRIDRNLPRELKEAIQPRHLSESVDPTMSGESRAENFGIYKGSTPTGEGRRYVHLWHTYLPKSNNVVYLPVHQGGVSDINPALSSHRWDGWKGGPYHVFGYDYTPDNLLWRAPIKDMIGDLGRVLNDLVTRIIDDIHQRKRIAVVDAADAESAERAHNAAHGAVVAGNVNASKSLEIGGLDNLTMIAFAHMKKLWDELGGHISILGGLPGNYPTATEATLRDTNASGKIEKMRQRTLRSVRDIVEAIAEYEWRDPDAGRVMEKELYAGIKRKLDFSYIHPRGGFKRWRIDVHPYSLQHRSPQQVVLMLDQFVQQILLPSLPLVQQSGVTFDMRAYIDTRAKLLDMPMLDTLLIPLHSASDTTQIPSNAGSFQQRQSPVTERIETRRSEAGQQGSEADLMKMLSASSLKGQEAA